MYRFGLFFTLLLAIFIVFLTSSQPPRGVSASDWEQQISGVTSSSGDLSSSSGSSVQDDTLNGSDYPKYIIYIFVLIVFVVLLKFVFGGLL